MEFTDDHLIIIRMLKHYPRMTFLEMSRRTRICLERIFEIYYELKDSGVLKTHTLISDHDYGIINVLLVFSLDINKDKMLDFLRQGEAVDSIMLTEREFIVHAGFSSLGEYDLFVDMLENIGVVELFEYFISEIVQ